MDEHQFKALINRSVEKPTLEFSKIKLSTLQNNLPVKGEFITTLRNKTRGTLAKVVVIKGRINSPPLFSKTTLIELGMLQICEDGSLGRPNSMRIQYSASNVNVITRGESTSEDQNDRETKSGGDMSQVHESSSVTKQGEASQPKTMAIGSNATSGGACEQVEEILNRYNHVFSGIGRIRDVKNNKELYVNFNMKAESAPVAQKPRLVPYYLQKPLKQWLDQGVEENLFEHVPQGEPVTWCSPLVVQPKPRFSNTPSDQLQSHMIRASVDLRVPNKFMERNRIMQGPLVEDFTYKFHDCVIFSKMDLRQVYMQLVLDPRSREVATFSTPWGNMRSKRLIFGAKASKDLFDETMYRLFGDIPKCLN